MKRIIQANIDRFKLLLEAETDPTKRITALLIPAAASKIKLT